MKHYPSRLAYYAPHGQPCAHKTLEVDLCIYGGTAPGIVAAVQAARDGLSTVVIENSNFVGGMTASGLGWTDFGNKETIGGLAREFYRKIGLRYNAAETWCFEPHVATAVFEQWISDTQLRVFRREYLAGVLVENLRLVAVRFESGLEVRAKMFIDASYEGDLLAAAGVSFTVGREGNAQYGETINGMLIHAKHQFDYPVDPYRVLGTPSSGLLPGIDPMQDFSSGAGDRRIQAYNFRMCLTNVAENRRPFLQPPGYDRTCYELLSRYFSGGWNDVFTKFDPIPGGKTDTNNHGAFSTDFIGQNHAWPEGNYPLREKLFQAHVTYQQGLQWFLANDPAVPATIREAYSQWGTPKDEFPETGGWPHALYVREARRLIGEYVMTEQDCRGQRACADPVAFGAYGMDSHNCRRIIYQGRLCNEGDVQAAGFPPYPISYRAIIPRRGECANLIVSACISASHIAYGSIRMEPVFMMLGQAAAAAAAIALADGCAVQDVDYQSLREHLLRNGQILSVGGETAHINEIV